MPVIFLILGLVFYKYPLINIPVNSFEIIKSKQNEKQPQKFFKAE